MLYSEVRKLEGAAGAEAAVLQMIDHWHEVDVKASTPAPFPLVQMQRLFVLTYLISMPFVLVDGTPLLYHPA